MDDLMEKRKMLAAVIFNENVEQLEALVSDLVPMNDEDIYVLCTMAIEIKNFNVLQIVFSKFPMDQFVNGLCEHDDIEHIQFCWQQHFIDFDQSILSTCDQLIYVCAKYNSVRVCQFLINHLCTVIEITYREINALHVACVYSHTEIVKIFCESGIFRINDTNALSQSSLHIACCIPINIDIVKTLVNAGIDVNLVDLFGNSALSNACHANAHAIVDYLLSQRNEVNLYVNENDLHIQKYRTENANLF